MTGASLRSIELGRPVAASLILAAFRVAAGSAVAVAWTDWSTALEERDASADSLARSVEAGRRAGLAPGAARPADPFVTAGSETLAAAAVDAILRSTVAATGSSLRSTRADAKPPEGDVAGRIEAQAVIDGSNDDLQAILAKLETGHPLMLVDELSIVPADDAGDPQSPRLRMTVTLSAFWRKPVRG